MIYPRFLFYLLLLALLFNFHYATAATAPFYIKGTIIPDAQDTAWWHTVYLSKMSSINDLFKSSPQLYVDSSVIDRNGVFKPRTPDLLTVKVRWF